MRDVVNNAERSKVRSTALFTAWTVLLLIVGGTLGMRIAISADMKEMSGWMIAVMDSRQRAEVAFSQYRGASFDGAKAALDRYAAYLEPLSPSSQPWKPGQAPLLDAQGLALEKLLTYGRVAVKAEASGRPEVASTYWEKAEREAQVLNWWRPFRFLGGSQHRGQVPSQLHPRFRGLQAGVWALERDGEFRPHFERLATGPGTIPRLSAGA